MLRAPIADESRRDSLALGATRDAEELVEIVKALGDPVRPSERRHPPGIDERERQRAAR